MFRNVRFYQLSGRWPDSEQSLHEALSAASFKPCGALTERSTGWEPPHSDQTDTLCRRVGGADLIQLRSQSRILPASAIKEVLEVRLDEYRQRMGQSPSRRELSRLKAQTRDDLLPKALLRSERTKGFLFLADQIVGVEAATPTKAEHFLEFLRIPLSGVDFKPLEFERPFGQLLTSIFMGDAPAGIQLGSECRMQDPSDNRASVRCVDMDLTDAGIRRHVKDGMKLTHLGIELSGVMSCVMDESGAFSKLRLLGMDAADVTDDEDPLARADAEFVLLTSTLRQLLSMVGSELA